MFTAAAFAGIVAPAEPIVQGAPVILGADPSDVWEWWVEARSGDRVAPTLLESVEFHENQGRACSERSDGRVPVPLQRHVALEPGTWTVRLAPRTPPVRTPPDEAWTEVVVTVRAPTEEEVRAMVWQARGQKVWIDQWRTSRCDEGVLAGDVFVPAILGRLGGPLDPGTRETLLGGLSATPTRAATDALLGLLDHRDPVVRTFALEALVARAVPPRSPWRSHEQAVVHASFAIGPLDAAEVPRLRAAARRLLVDDLSSEDGVRRARSAARALAQVGEPEDGVAVDELLAGLVGAPVSPWVLEPLAEARARLGITSGPLAIGHRADRTDAARVEAALLAGLAHPASSVRAFALERVQPSPSEAVRAAVVEAARGVTVELDRVVWDAVQRMGPPVPSEVVLDAVPVAARSVHGLSGLIRAARAVEVRRDRLAATIAVVIADPDPDAGVRAARGLYEVVLGARGEARPKRLAALAAGWPGWISAHAAELAAGQTFRPEELPAELRP